MTRYATTQLFRRSLILILLNVLLPIHIIAVCYELADDSIDIVIPSCEKDLETLELAIRHAVQHVAGVRRVIVVSDHRFTDQAEWFDEKLYPFTKEQVEKALDRKEKKVGKRVGWYYQQLLKLYAHRVIPGLSSNVLILDSDTIFLRPVQFINARNGSLFCPSSEHHNPYYRHMKKFVGINQYNVKQSGISHHMLFQRAVLDHLFETVEQKHDCLLWEAFCRCVSVKELRKSGASEYEIYFNFALHHTDQVAVRPLKFANISSCSELDKWRVAGYDFVSCHSYLRN